MPTGLVTLYPGVDGYVRRDAQSSWADAHDAVTGEGVNTSYAQSAYSIRTSFTTPGRGGGHYISRVFLSFNTSRIFNKPSKGQLSINGFSTTAIPVVYCVKATSDIESGLSTSEFDAIEGWDHDADNSSTGTIYAPATSSWVTGSNNFPLKEVALNDIAGQDRLNICLLSSRDILNTGGNFPLSHSTAYSGVRFVESPLSLRPNIKLTTQDDAVFMGANF